MAESRVINVGGDNIGIRGLDQVLEEMAGQFAHRPDQEVAAEMLSRLENRNYFSPRYLDQYAAALVREFRRHLGQPHKPEARKVAEVKIPRPGCSCMKG